jgi:hypothetical protein
MTADRIAVTMNFEMTRKQTVTADPAGRQVFQTQASIQYLRTGGRRPTARTAGPVPAGEVAGVRPFFAL